MECKESNWGSDLANNKNMEDRPIVSGTNNGFSPFFNDMYTNLSKQGKCLGLQYSKKDFLVITPSMQTKYHKECISLLLLVIFIVI
jgi:hypothetical protein